MILMPSQRDSRTDQMTESCFKDRSEFLCLCGHVAVTTCPLAVLHRLGLRRLIDPFKPLLQAFRWVISGEYNGEIKQLSIAQLGLFCCVRECYIAVKDVVRNIIK